MSPTKTFPEQLHTIVQPTVADGDRRRHSATLIFFHGLGDRADNVVQWFRYLLGGRDLLQHYAHIKVIIPSAPRQAFTLFGGRPANVWFDSFGNEANLGLPERRASFAPIDRLVGDLIDAEVAAGIPLDRIAVAGFSMGGQMALHTAFRLRPGMAGVCALSTFLAYDTAVFEALEAAGGGCSTPLLMHHGDRDDLLPYPWGRVTFSELRRLGVRGEFRTIEGMKHAMRAVELVEVEKWLVERMPPLPRDIVNKL